MGQGYKSLCLVSEVVLQFCYKAGIKFHPPWGKGSGGRWEWREMDAQSFVLPELSSELRAQCAQVRLH